MRRTAAAIGSVAVVGLLAAGCGSSSSDADDDDTTTTTAMVAESPMTDEELSELLLTPSEVGTGWAVDPTGGGGGLSAPSCLQDVDAGDSIADADAAYANGEAVFAFEGLGAQESEDEAKTAYEIVTTALDDCTEVTTSSQGTEIAGTITANGEVDYGDAAKSYSMAFVTAQSVPIDIDVVVAYVGDIDVVVMYGTVGTADPGAIDTMAEQAIDKIGSAG